MIDPSKKVSKYFTWGELVHTDHTEFLQQNAEEAEVFEAVLTRVAVELLDPIREHFGPTKIDSAFRCEILNTYVKGSATSQHRFGQAGDIKVLAYDTPDGRLVVVQWILDNKMKFHQLLVEGGCIHISLATGINDGQVRYAKPDPNNPGHWILTSFSA